MTGYALVRPPVESLFLAAHGADALPVAWLLVALAAAASVALYTRLSAGRDLGVVFAATATLSAALLALLIVAVKADLPGAHYALYVWKDVYIVVLVEIFWSATNCLFPLKTARWAYGLFNAAGSAGGIVGNLVTGKLALAFGTSTALWAGVAPLVIVAVAVGAKLRVGADGELQPPVRPSLIEAAGVVRRSRYLLLVLLLIGVVQVTITLVDWAYNAVVVEAFTDTDARTAVMGQVYAAVAGGAVVLSLLTGPALKLLGVAGGLLGVPVMLGAALLAWALVPGFATAAAAKIASKVLDYSWFRAAKELLYLPLSYDEKTRGKAMVDMLTYRVAKGAASVLLLALAGLRASGPVVAACLVLVGVWIALTVEIVRRRRSVGAAPPSPPVGLPDAGSR